MVIILKQIVIDKLGEFEKAKPLYDKSIEKSKGTSSEAQRKLCFWSQYICLQEILKQQEKTIKEQLK